VALYFDSAKPYGPHSQETPPSFCYFGVPSQQLSHDAIAAAVSIRRKTSELVHGPDNNNDRAVVTKDEALTNP